MSTPYDKADILARFRLLPSKDRLRFASARTVEEARSIAAELARREAFTACRSRIRPPAKIVAAGLTEAWIAGVIKAAVARVSGDEEVTLEQMLPSFFKAETERRERSLMRLPELRAVRGSSVEERTAYLEARRLDGGRARSPAPLSSRVTMLKIIETGIFAAEALIVGTTAGTATGAFDQPASAWLNPAVWGPTAGLAVGGLIITAGSAHLLAKKLYELGDNDEQARRYAKLGGIGLVIGLVGVVFANAAVRVGAVAGDPELATIATTAGTLVTSVLAVLGAIAALASVKANRMKLEERLEAVRTRFEDDRATEGELTKAATEAVQELEATEADAARLPEIQTQAEADIAAATALLEDAKFRSVDQMEQAVSAFEALSEMPAAVRSSVLRELAAEANAGSGAVKGTGALGVALLIAGSFSGSACRSDARPTSVVTVADATSRVEESRGDRRVVNAMVDGWSATRGFREGARFTVVVPSSTFSATAMVAVGAVPPRFLGDPRIGRRRFLDEAHARVATLPLPESPTARDNMSNLTAALHVAERAVQGLDDHFKVLVIASDGLIVNGAASFERRVPSPEAFFAALEKKEGGKPQLTFDRVVVCGLRHENVGAADAARRDEIWRALLDGPGRSVTFLTEGCPSITAETFTAYFTPSPSTGAEKE